VSTSSSPALTRAEIEERIAFYNVQLIALAAGSAANRMSRDEWAANVDATERRLAALKTALKLQRM
jgi:hypothetical protein